MGRSARTRRLILVIDDVVTAREVIEISLRGLPADLHVAGDGREGLELAKELLPDLIVLDLALPVISGDAVLARLRQDPATAAIPVMVVTAHGQSGMATFVMELGADAFIEKPFLPAELLAAAEKLLDLSDRALPAAQGAAPGQPVDTRGG